MPDPSPTDALWMTAQRASEGSTGALVPTPASGAGALPYPDRVSGARADGSAGPLAHDQQGVTCTTSLPVSRTLTPAAIAQLYRELIVRDKSYQAYPLGQDAAEYLRGKRKRLTEGSHIAYESVLDKLARRYPDKHLEDFEPPVGTTWVDELMDDEWGHLAPGSYNRNLSILRDFFRWAIMRGRLHGDPTLAIERARVRDIHREIFRDEDRLRILAQNADRRDRIALRLLLDYGLRKGALRAVQFSHFNHERKRLTIFTKGERVRKLPIPDPAFWHDLGRLLIDLEASGSDYLMARQRRTPTGGVRRFPDQPMGGHALHDWWYRCLATAGIVPEGTTSGSRMHMARHTAGQRMLDATGNLKAAQKLLGHASISTTADIYTDYDVDELAVFMRRVLAEDG